MNDDVYTASIQFSTELSAITCECGFCDWRGMADALAPIENAILTPGDSSPAGRCPECDSLAYVVIESLSDGTGWVAICNKQGWNDASQITHLEGFIRQAGLFSMLTDYARAVADEENS